MMLAMRADLPQGTVTFLFTDIEGSTRLLQRAGAGYADLLLRHRELLRGAFVAHDGHEVDMEGDGFFVVFASARAAAAAAVEGQRRLAAHDWPGGHEVRVRMGLHTGEPRLLDGSYVGLDVHRAARVMAAGHGGQVLLTHATRDLLDDATPVRDLGEHRLMDLSAPLRLFQLEIEGLPSEFPALKTLESHQANLPVQPTPLIGRERELAELAALLGREEVRLLTLTGPGGSGKTRLALQLAADLVDDFSDGVFFAGLAPVRDASLVIPTLAQTLGVREHAGHAVADTLADYLRHRTLLLLLDNLEQVSDAAPALASLLAAAPNLRMLATSRAPLRLAAEHLYDVPPLALPEITRSDKFADLARFAAVRLFVERGRAARSDFELTADNAATVAQICVHLDGLPLAIELAAARARVLSPQAILARLDRRLSLLTGGRRELEQRQQTLSATIQWSYDLLPAEEQTLFARLGVFLGGCRVDAAHAVCNPNEELGVDTLDALSSLLEQSLLRQRDDPDREPRFWMLETIKEFAAERNARQDVTGEASRRHLLHFVALSERAEPSLRSAEQEEWIALLRRELGNLRSALDTATRLEETELALTLIANLGWFWDVVGAYDELRARVRSLALTAQPTAAAAKSLYFASFYARRQGDIVDADKLIDQSVEIARQAGDTRAQTMALAQQGFVALHHGDTEQALALGDEALAIARRSTNDWEEAYALNNLAHVYAELARYEEAIKLYTESATIVRRLGDRRLLGAPLQNLAHLALLNEDVAGSAQLHQEALANAELFHDLPFQAAHLAGLGWTSLLRHQFAEAEKLLLRAIGIAAEIGDPAGVSDCLRGLAAIDAESQQAQNASKLLAAADGIAETAGITLDPLATRLRAQVIASLERQLEKFDAKQHRRSGALTLDQAVALAQAPPRQTS
jgi:predicted ATPase/class 3 adenylate cyclase